MPGPDFVPGFLERHPVLSNRTANLIKRSRAALSHEIVDSFFERYKKSLGDIPPENVYNYDETNLQAKLKALRNTKYYVPVPIPVNVMF